MAFYLFPKTMYQRFITAESAVHEAYDKNNNLKQVLVTAYELYQLCTVQYYGFGALLQFIPGTDANKARKQLMNALEPALLALKDEFKKEHPILDANLRALPSLIKNGYHSYLDSYINLKPFFVLVDDIILGFKFTSADRSQPSTFKRYIFSFPLVSAAFYIDSNEQINLAPTPLKNVLHQLINPMRFITGVINFLHVGAHKLLDLWPDNGPTVSTPKYLVKGAVGVVFGLMMLPITLLKHLIDWIPLALFQSVIVDPIVHLGTSIKEAYLNRSKETLVITAKELRDVKELRRAAKHRDASYIAITKATNYQTEYFGVTKERLYTKGQVEPERLLTLRAPSEKINNIASLLAIVTHFRGTNNNPAKNIPAAVIEAKVVLAPKNNI